VAPIVVLTSNRTRDLRDALKRRCLYHWIDYPSLERTVAIVRRRVPSATMPVVEQAAAAVARLRSLDVQKLPGVAETIDWVSALTMLGLDHLAPDGADATLGSVLKYREDLDVARARGLEWLTHSGP
jgi:MoxR-like ATPase